MFKTNELVQPNALFIKDDRMISTGNIIRDAQIQQLLTYVAAMIEEGDRGAEALKILLSHIHPEDLADTSIATLNKLPATLPPLTGLARRRRH